MSSRHLLLESGASRRVAVLVFLGLALVSPSLPLPGSLPAVRLEQIWLAALLPSLIVLHYTHRELRRLLPVDIAFALLFATVALTLAFAPAFVGGVSRSPRDVFELARVVEYWAALRLALAAGPDLRPRGTLAALLAVAVFASALAAVIQYLDPGAYNRWITDIWASAHSLNGTIRRGRAVGFVGNPNYFGAACGLLLVVLLARVALVRDGGTRRHRRLIPALILAAAGAATAGLLLSQSRTAAFATLGGLTVELLWTAAMHGRSARYVAPVASVLVAIGLTLAFAEAFPPDYGGLRQRFQISSLSEDSSFSLRVTRWRNFVEGVFRDPPGICTGEPLDSAVVPGHEPRGNGSGASEAAARDDRRKNDIRALTSALVDYFCDEDTWPVEDPEAAIVPSRLDDMPRDPGTGDRYDLYVISGGFVASAQLEADDPVGPRFALGTVPNYVTNSSFESGSTTPAGWSTAGAADGRTKTALEISGEGRFGEHSVLANIGGGSAFYQQIVQDLAPGQVYTASFWSRATREPEEVQLYLVGTTADGTVLDPLARSEPMALIPGEWRTGSLTFVTPESSRLVVLSIFLRSPADGDPVEALFDAVTLTPGPLVPSYPWLRDASRAERSTLPGFGDSPVLGVGPLKDLELGALDNEYALFLDRYGALGLLAYLALFGTAFLTAGRASRAAESETAALGLGLGVGIVVLMVFSIAAGAFYNFQLMAVFWPLTGIAAAWTARKDSARDV
ncbi:MAG: carbohydrate binding domain-containing protein [Dehalococcoidia bacterium]